MGEGKNQRKPNPLPATLRVFLAGDVVTVRSLENLLKQTSNIKILASTYWRMLVSGEGSHVQPTLSPMQLAFPIGIEPTTYGLGLRCSIHLSYENVMGDVGFEPTTKGL